MESKLDLKVYGVRGGAPSWTPNKGGVSCLMDKDNYMFIDAFEGAGSNYTRRPQCNVRVNYCGKDVFYGPFEEMAQILSANKKKITYYLFGKDASITLDNEGIDVLIEEFDPDDSAFSLFTFIEGVTNHQELLAEMDGWDGYSEITANQYDQLLKIQ